MPSAPPVIAYLFTTFPKTTETFLRREITALLSQGLNLRLYSLWGGGGMFAGRPVARFNKWRLFSLPWLIVRESARRPAVLWQLWCGLVSRPAPSWLNFWENMLGAGFACVHLHAFRQSPPALIHAAWGGAPATAAWLFWRVDGHRYSAAAHAYDLFEHGGDWWLREKLESATFVHTSTEVGRRALLELGLDPGRVHRIRRGLTKLPALKPLLKPRRPLRLIAVARLVEKKGLDHQLRLYAALRDAGFPFVAKIVGDGPRRLELERLARGLGLKNETVTFTGAVSADEVWEHLAWADVLLHTGVIARSGDRDGLPNVIPEAMATGTLVVTSPTSGATEAVSDGLTGLVAEIGATGDWMSALKQLATDDVLAARLQQAARAWVEQHFDAHRNARQLRARFEEAMRTP